MSCPNLNTECTISSTRIFAPYVHVQKTQSAYNGAMRHRLKEIRKERGLTQTEMADLLGLSLRGYVYIEQGERELQLKYVRLLSEKFKIPESEFFDQTGGGVSSDLLMKLKQLSEKQQAAFEAMLDSMIKTDKGK